MFGDPESNSVGRVEYNHANDTLALYSDGVANVIIDAVGIITMPNQVAFNVFDSASDVNVTGNGATATVEFDGSNFDQNSDFNNTTDTFTAPATGKYHLNTAVLIAGLVSATLIEISIVTSNRSYKASWASPSDSGFSAGLNVIADMEAADTATVTLRITGMSGDDADIIGGASDTWFSGCLLA